MLTNEELHEIRGSAFALKSMTESEQIQIIDELLTIRSLRDAGDDEVDRLLHKCEQCFREQHNSDLIPEQRADSQAILIANTRKIAEKYRNLAESKLGMDRAVMVLNNGNDQLSQQLREAREEIKRLTEENKRLHDEAEVSDSLVLTLQEEVKMLTTERDEARKLLSELHSAPEMKEVDALGTALLDVIQTISNRYGIGVAGVNATRRAKDVIAIARRAIASREEEKQRADEVAGLLKWWVSFKDGFGQLEGMSAGSAVEEWKDNARRILEIAEGE